MRPERDSHLETFRVDFGGHFGLKGHKNLSTWYRLVGQNRRRPVYKNAPSGSRLDEANMSVRSAFSSPEAMQKAVQTTLWTDSSEPRDRRSLYPTGTSTRSVSLLEELARRIQQPRVCTARASPETRLFDTHSWLLFSLPPCSSLWRPCWPPTDVASEPEKHQRDGRTSGLCCTAKCSSNKETCSN